MNRVKLCVIVLLLGAMAGCRGTPAPVAERRQDAELQAGTRAALGEAATPLDREKRPLFPGGRYVLFVGGDAPLPAAAPVWGYESSCILSLNDAVPYHMASAKTKPAVVEAEFLRYDRVMYALMDTNILRGIETQAKNDPILLEQLKEKLYRKIVANTSVEALGPTVIRVTYFDDMPSSAQIVLQGLCTTFVESTLRQERDDARSVKTMAGQGLIKARSELESVEQRIVTFREDHPGVGTGQAQAALAGTLKELERTNVELGASRAQLKKYEGILEAGVEKPQQAAAGNKPAPLSPALRDRILEKKWELESRIDYLTELVRRFVMDKEALEEKVAAAPTVEKELNKLNRDRDSALTRYEAARNEYERADREFNMRMKGLAEVTIVRPPRLPQEKVERRAAPGQFSGLYSRIEFVPEERFQQLLKHVAEFLDQALPPAAR